MNISSKLDQLHFKARQNKWLGYFAICMRIGLAWGFLPSGIVKIMGERFTSLNTLHPMGHYLEAVHRTGFYYTFMGIGQVTAAILLLIPRTATLGAIIYFPIILNICILSIAVRFEGSLLSSPLMVLANLFLLCWDYHKIKYILPFHHNTSKQALPITRSNKFPVWFFAGVFVVFASIALFNFKGYDLLPRNTIADCNSRCDDNAYPEACYNFCDCIHNRGESLNKCMEEYDKAVAFLKKNKPKPE